MVAIGAIGSYTRTPWYHGGGGGRRVEGGVKGSIFLMWLIVRVEESSFGVFGYIYLSTCGVSSSELVSEQCEISWTRTPSIQYRRLISGLAHQNERTILIFFFYQSR